MKDIEFHFISRKMCRKWSEGLVIPYWIQHAEAVTVEGKTWLNFRSLIKEILFQFCIMVLIVVSCLFIWNLFVESVMKCSDVAPEVPSNGSTIIDKYLFKFINETSSGENEM